MRELCHFLGYNRIIGLMLCVSVDIIVVIISVLKSLYLGLKVLDYRNQLN